MAALVLWVVIGLVSTIGTGCLFFQENIKESNKDVELTVVDLCAILSLIILSILCGFVSFMFFIVKLSETKYISKLLATVIFTIKSGK